MDNLLEALRQCLKNAKKPEVRRNVRDEDLGRGSTCTTADFQRLGKVGEKKRLVGDIRRNFQLHDVVTCARQIERDIDKEPYLINLGLRRLVFHNSQKFILLLIIRN